MYNFIWNGLYYYAKHNPSIRADKNGNIFGGGGGDEPELNYPPPPPLKSAEEHFQESLASQKAQFPLGLGAREEALGDLSRGSEFYEEFQPTSIEDALANQYFQNVWPDVQKEIKHGLSLSGMESSPILAAQLGKARGQVGFDIGSYLANQGQQRGEFSLSNRLGMNPMQQLQPQMDMSAQIDQQQKQMDYQYSVQKAQMDYQKNVAKAQKKAGMASTIGTVLGTIGGAIVGGPGGAAIGGSIGGSIGGAIGGGGQSPINFGDAMAIQGQYGNQWGGGQTGQTGQTTQVSMGDLNRSWNPNTNQISFAEAL